MRLFRDACEAWAHAARVNSRIQIIDDLPPALQRWRQRRHDVAPTSERWSGLCIIPLPYAQMDLCLYGFENGIPAAGVARATGLTADQVMLVWADIEAKRKARRYLHEPPLLISDADGEELGTISA
jgi:hypothetical protein